MTRLWKLYWAAVILALGIYLTMVIWSLPKITNFADGLRAFDLLPFGYSHQYALSFLQALYAGGPDAVRFYAEVQHGLDMVFPALSAFVLMVPIWRLSKGLRRSVRWALTLLPVIGSAFDYVENARVSAMLNHLPDMPTESEVYWSSVATLMKSGFVTAAFCALLALASRGLFRKLAGKRTR